MRGALCLVISVWVLLGTYGAVGGTFFQKKSVTEIRTYAVGILLDR